MRLHRALGGSLQVLAFGIMAVGTLHAAGLPQRKKSIPLKAPQRPYGTRYAESVAGITCDTAAQRVSTALSDEPILREIPQLLTKQYLDQKGEYETTAAYEARHAQQLRQLFGSADTIAIVRKVDDLASYDADKGILSIKLLDINYLNSRDPKYSFGKVLEVEDRGTYRASNAYGATASVSKSRFSSMSYGFDSTGMNIETKVSLPLDPNAARLFKTEGKIIMVATLLQSNVFARLEHDAPTISDPSDTYWHYNYVKVQPSCILMGSNGKYTKVM